MPPTQQKPNARRSAFRQFETDFDFGGRAGYEFPADVLDCLEQLGLGLKRGLADFLPRFGKLPIQNMPKAEIGSDRPVGVGQQGDTHFAVAG
jgi:hypothetical protein